MAEELIPIVQRADDFAVALYGSVNRFPRSAMPAGAGDRRGLTAGLTGPTRLVEGRSPSSR